MITPAVLISACGTLILSTSTRLGRVVDRVRALAEQFEMLARPDTELELLEERRAMLFNQLDKLTSRSRLLQRSMTVFYLALGVFVSTSVSIGMSAFLAWATAGSRWCSAFSARFFLYGSILLIFEQRLALSTTFAEMDFIWRLGKHYASDELIEQQLQRHPQHRRSLRRHGEHDKE
ncbi:MAG: DUF2721 domain-containing protein [Pyrinomonadaceae bacterium]